MRLRWLFLATVSTMLSGQLSPSYGQETRPAAPLTDQEKREALDRLIELRIARAELSVLHAHIDKDEKQDARERAVAARELKNEERATAIAEKERDIEKRQREFAEAALKAATRGRGGWCAAKKIMSLGLIRCN